MGAMHQVDLLLVLSFLPQAAKLANLKPCVDVAQQYFPWLSA
jgi:hypothetical protein